MQRIICQRLRGRALGETSAAHAPRGRRRRRRSHRLGAGIRVPWVVAVFAVALGSTAQLHAQGSEPAAEPAPSTDTAPGTPSAEAPEAGTPVPPGAAAASTGEVHVIVFGADVPAAGAVVIAPDGREFPTNASGAAYLELPAGSQALQVRWPADAEPKSLGDVAVASGQTTEVIATIGLDGTVTLDVMAPAGLTPEEAASAAAEPEVVETGRVTGEVIGEEDGQPVVGARIYVAGHDVEGTTDETGHFELELPVGTHTLSVLHTKYSTQTVADVVVTAEPTAAVKVSLTPAAIELEEFVVTAPHIAGGVASVLVERRQSAAVSDSIGAADIAKMPANDAAQAAQRVVGATIVGGRFVYVRGLGERYSNALLNGAPLPSPEPDRATVPLDLFPSQILESLDISKTFTPDVPGDFAGGSVRIKTKGAPDEFLFGASLSLGLESRTTFLDYYGQKHHGDLDWLALDDGSRDLSSEVPRDMMLENRSGRDLLEELASDINTPLGLKPRTMGPNASGSVAIGDSWDLGKDVRFGTLASLVYRNTSDLRREPTLITASFLGAEDAETGRTFRADSDYRAARSNLGVRWGAFSNSTLLLGDDHKLSLLLMHSQLGDTSVYSVHGTSLISDRPYAVESIRQEFITRGLTNGQLQGEHKFTELNEAQLNWLLALANAGRKESDTRTFIGLLRANEDPPVWDWREASDSGRHFYSDQSEFAKVGGLDWTQPIVTGDWGLKAKTGALASLKDREFQARTLFLGRFDNRLDETLYTCPTPFDPVACPDSIVSDELLDMGGFRALDSTRPTDAYNAKLNVLAAYLMAEVELGEQWRFIGGARVEDTLQSISPFDQFSGDEQTNMGARLKQTDLLPAVSIVYSPFEEGAIRLAATQTLARPQLRELAPFAFQDYFGGFLQSGNPDLELTRILNGDLRFEYFPSPEEVLALSLFAKDFTKPIEPTIKPSGDGTTLTYQNAKGAFLYGAEVEVRKNLGFFGEVMEPFGIIASLMLSDSSIRVEQPKGSTVEILTNTQRALVQAAPYVINAAIDYENEAGTQFRVLYNVSGPRIVAVGVDGLDDTYLQPRHTVDLTASQALGEHFKLRLNATNLLDATYLETIGREKIDKNVVRRFKDGISVSLGLTYNH